MVSVGTSLVWRFMAVCDWISVFVRCIVNSAVAFGITFTCVYMCVVSYLVCLLVALWWFYIYGVWVLLVVEFAWCLGVCCFVVFWFGLPAVGRLVLWFARWRVVCSLLGFLFVCCSCFYV